MEGRTKSAFIVACSIGRDGHIQARYGCRCRGDTFVIKVVLPSHAVAVAYVGGEVRGAPSGGGCGGWEGQGSG